MSCNPSFGGVGKGTLVREIDALGGLCGKLCDASGIHFRLLNASRGPAVYGPRAQIDRKMYRENMQKILLSGDYPNLSVMAASVRDIVFDGDLSQTSTEGGIQKCRVKGIQTECGKIILARKIVLATGTFLSGTIRIGNWIGKRLYLLYP